MMFSLPASPPRPTRSAGVVLLVLTLTACSGSGSAVTVNGDVPIAYV